MDLFDILTAVTTNTLPRRFFFSLSVETWVFAGHQSTVSMGFSRALIEKVPSSLNEGGETYKNNFE